MTVLNVFRYGSFRLGRITEEKIYTVNMKLTFVMHSQKCKCFFKVWKNSMDAAVNGNFCETANILK
jgi:hypothetical protein